MRSYPSAGLPIPIDQHEPASPGPHPALLLLHGSGGAASSWIDRIAPHLIAAGIATYAPHYFSKTGTQRATAETILDGKHVPQWLAAIHDAVSYIASRPSIDARRIAVLGVSLGGYLAVALGIENPGLRAIIELSGGVPPGSEPRITQAMPPTLILHGIEDRVVPVTEAHKLSALCRQQNVPCEMELFPGESHWFSTRAQQALLLRAASFLTRHL